MKRISIGVIGVGEWGRNHVRVYRELLEADLIQIADINKGALEKQALKFRVDTTTDPEKFLSDTNIQAVSICTPSSTHYELCKHALECGKDVLVEKPLALDSKEARELVKVAQNEEKILMVGHIFRFHPTIQELKQEIDKGTFGHVNFLYGARMGLRTPRMDCGVIFDFAIHDCDIFCYLLDKHYPEEITATGASILEDTPEDVGFVVLHFPKNILAQIQVSWLTPKKTRELWLVGDEQCASVDYLTQELEIFRQRVIPTYDTFGTFKLATRQGVAYKPYIDNQEPLKIELQHFLKCIKSRHEPFSNGMVGVRAIEIIEGCYQSLKSKRTITMNKKS